MSNVHIHIPTDAQSLDMLKGMPIHQFTMNHFPGNERVNVSQCRFQLDNGDKERTLSLFTVGEHTGEVTLGRGFAKQGGC